MKKLSLFLSTITLALAISPHLIAAPHNDVSTTPTPFTISLTEDEFIDLELFDLTHLAHHGGNRYHRGDYRPRYYRNTPKKRYRFSPRRSNSEYYGNRSIDDGQFAEFANRSATGNKVFIFDPRRLKWYAYSRSGNLVASGRASGGAHYCRDVRRACRTPAGSFKVYRKGSAYCKSNKYPLGRGGAPMPHCMFFKGGYAIHGSPDVPGRNASHGCIRVLPGAARWLHRNFIDHGTTVIVRPY